MLTSVCNNKCDKHPVYEYGSCPWAYRNINLTNVGFCVIKCVTGQLIKSESSMLCEVENILMI